MPNTSANFLMSIFPKEGVLHGKNCLNFSSLGQQRTVILALKLAEIGFIKEKNYFKEIYIHEIEQKWGVNL